MTLVSSSNTVNCLCSFILKLRREFKYDTHWKTENKRVSFNFLVVAKDTWNRTNCIYRFWQISKYIRLPINFDFLVFPDNATSTMFSLREEFIEIFSLLGKFGVIIPKIWNPNLVVWFIFLSPSNSLCSFYTKLSSEVAMNEWCMEKCLTWILVTLLVACK